MKGTFTLKDGDTAWVVPVERVASIKITPNGEFSSVVFYVDGAPSITMSSVSPSDVEKIIERLANGND
jgi:hypothetical protein